jgi:hypothetical protein
MGDEILQFINGWVYNVDAYLRRNLDSLKDDLASDDEGVKKNADKQAENIFCWIAPPLPPLPASARIERAEAALSNESTTAEEKIAAAQRVMRSTGRSRGRPRDETSQYAVKALALHYATQLSWRQIALEIKGCNHSLHRPNVNLACEPCGEAVRAASQRLEKFLKSTGFDIDFALGKTLNEPSRQELLRLWQIGKTAPDPRI